MQVPATSSSTSTSSSSSSSAASAAASAVSATVDYNQFLQLLVAELKNQDPTSPADPMQYMSQLASFSNVAQQIQTNSKLDTILTSSALSQADGVIGKTLTSADGNTSGVVSSVTVSSGTATATLLDGSTITLGSGVKVSGS